MIEFDSVLHYIEDMNTLYPMVEGRVTLLNYKKPSVVTEPPVVAHGSELRSTVSVFIILVAIAIILNQS